MAEFCRDCFIEVFRPSQAEIDSIVMAKERCLCEGCGKIVDEFVLSVNPTSIIDRFRKRGRR